MTSRRNVFRRRRDDERLPPTGSTSMSHRGAGTAMMSFNVVVFVAAIVDCFRSAVGGDLFAQQASRGPVLMLSRGQEYDVTIGAKLVLDCEFHMDDYRMFDNPTVWEKTQLDERSRVNIMAVVQEPFASTKRFEVSFVSNKPRHRLRLTIKDVSLEDSGNYTCEIRGRKSTVLSHVTHFVHVRWPLKQLAITSDPPPSDRGDSVVVSMTSSSSSSSPQQQQQQQQSSVTSSSLLLEDGQTLSVRCVAQSGCPAPELTMRIGQADVTSQFRRTEHPIVVGGERGLRSMTCSVSLWSWAQPVSLSGGRRPMTGGDNEAVAAEAGTFVVLHLYDGMALRCGASAGRGQVNTNWTEVGLLVQFAPRVTCLQTSAELGEYQVKLECRVRSRPGPTSLYWVVDSNGTTVSSGDSVNEHWTQVRDVGDGTLETRLYLRRVGLDSFRKYLLVAENAVGTTTHDVDLVRGASKLRVPPTASSTSGRRLPPPVPDSSSSFVGTNHVMRQPSPGVVHVRHEHQQPPGNTSSMLAMDVRRGGLREWHAAAAAAASSTSSSLTHALSVSGRAVFAAVVVVMVTLVT